MLEVIALVIALATAGSSGFAIYKLEELRKQIPDQSEVDASHQKALAEIQAVSEQAKKDTVKALALMKALAPKTITRKLCSDCHRMVWKYEEYEGNIIICSDCERIASIPVPIDRLEKGVSR